MKLYNIYILAVNRRILPTIFLLEGGGSVTFRAREKMFNYNTDYSVTSEQGTLCFVPCREVVPISEVK